MRNFDTDQSAKEFVRCQTDVPITETSIALDTNLVPYTLSRELENGIFAKV